LRATRTVVGVVLLKSIRVAYTFRQCSPQRTIVSAAAGVVRCDAVCTDMRSHVVPDVVSRFPQTATH
jgi:hypothetical protein